MNTKATKGKPTKAALQTAAAVQGARSAYASVVPRPMRQVISLPAKDVRPDPNQPRKVFDETRISALASSIAATGQLTPITVRKEFDEESATHRYWIIAGERRWRAIMALSEIEGTARTIDAVVLDHEHPEVVALVENVAREDLDVFEEAAAVRRLQEAHGFNATALCEFLGWDKSTVSRILKVAAINPVLLEQIRAARPDGRGFVLALVDAPEEERADIVASAIASDNLTRAFVRAWRKPVAAPALDAANPPAVEPETTAGPAAEPEAAAPPAVAEPPHGSHDEGVDPDEGEEQQALEERQAPVTAGDAGESAADERKAPVVPPAPQGSHDGADLVNSLEALLARHKPSRMVLTDSVAIERLERVVDSLAKVVSRSIKREG